MRDRWVLALLLAVMMSTTAYTAEQYINDVRHDRIVVCKWVRLAVERHIYDVERAAKDDDSFPYYFDEKQARREIDFKQQLRHTQGEWANERLHDPRIRLEPWQQFIDAEIFGWRQRSDGCRRFRKVYISVAKKNGKTVGAAGTGNYCFMADRPREIGAEIYCAATKKDQAKKAWTEMQQQLMKHPLLKTRTRPYKQSFTIVRKDDAAAFVRLLGKDSKSEDGVNVHFGLVDEYHAHKDSSMLEVLVSATAARQQPLIYIITTAGFNKESPCFQEEHALSEQVLQRSMEPVPEHYFCIIFTLDEDDDWTDPAVWIKANPNLGVSVKWDFLEQQVKDAINSPQKQNAVKTKSFNIWTQAETRWILDEKWQRCDAAVDEEDLVGRPAFAGLDLSTSIDITAMALCFPPEKDEEDQIYRLLWRFFIPKENMLERMRRDKVPYQDWVDRGFVVATPGDVIDYNFIKATFHEDAKRFDIKEVPYDPYNSNQVVVDLSQDGFEVMEFRQGYLTMSPAAKDFEAKVLLRQLAHGNNPVMRWMVACTEVAQDPAGNIKPVKPHRHKSGKRIDGVIAGIMATWRATQHVETRSVYETGGLKVV